MIKLAEIKKSLFPVEADFSAEADDETGTVIAYLTTRDHCIAGVFCLEGKASEVSVKAPDGEYTNEITGKGFILSDGIIKTAGSPVIFRIR